MTINYVAGFLLNPDNANVALIRKEKGPPNIIGKLNAIGGKIKIENDEDANYAMAREFQEETGVTIPSDEWREFLELRYSDAWSVRFFIAHSDLVYKVRTIEEEKVEVYRVSDLHTLDVVPNVRWILPMGLSLYRGESASCFSVIEIHN